MTARACPVVYSARACSARVMVAATSPPSGLGSSSSSKAQSIAIVGAGPIGSAAARHILERTSADALAQVYVIDGTQAGTRGSHHDLARLIRAADAEGDAKWSVRNAASLAAFAEIERESGCNFFHKSGALVVGPRTFVERAAKAAQTAGCELELLDDVRERFAFLTPATGCDAALYDDSAGWLEPNAMIEAQLEYARRRHSDRIHVVPAAVQSIEVLDSTGGGSGGVFVELSTGAMLVVDKCLVTAGAHTRALADGMVAGKLDGVSVSRRTVALLEISESTAHELEKVMPTLKYRFEEGGGASVSGNEQSKTEATSVYLLPPVRYDNLGGRYFIKIGGGPNDLMPENVSSEEIAEWLASGGDAEMASKLADIGRNLLGGVTFANEGHETMACVTTVGSDDMRIVSSPCKRVTAVSCCLGKAAGPADAIGAEIAKHVVGISDRCIEVERKFAPPSDLQTLRESVSRLGGGLDSEKVTRFVDEYYDVPSLALVASDCWLRTRKVEGAASSSWELKLPVDVESRSGGEREVFREVVGLEHVASELAQILHEPSLSADAWKGVLERIESENSSTTLASIAKFATERFTFTLDDCSIDVDSADFGHAVMEVEKLVASPDEIPGAKDEIARIASSIGATPLPPQNGGKLLVYLRKYRQDVIDVLVRSGILKE